MLKVIKVGILVFQTIFFIDSPKAQTKVNLNFGEVKVDSNFSCYNTSEWYDSLNYDIESICKSKNELEIRLNTWYLPGAGSGLICLTYNKGKWDAVKYSYFRSPPTNRIEKVTFKPSSVDTEIIPSSGISMYDYVFGLLFDTLKSNNIFLLPDQDELNIDRSVNDGVGYKISYKVGNKFRSYGFDNPQAYRESYPEKKEFYQYIIIVQHLFRLFH